MSMPYVPRDRSDDYEEEAEVVFQILGITMMGWSEPCTLYDFTYDPNDADQRRQLDELFRCPWAPDEPLVDILERARQAAARRAE